MSPDLESVGVVFFPWFPYYEPALPETAGSPILRLESFDSPRRPVTWEIVCSKTVNIHSRRGSRRELLVSLVRKLLFRDKTRLAITLSGTSLALLLIFTLTGIYLGFYHQATAFIDNSGADLWVRSEEHTSELQSLAYLVCRLLLEKKKKKQNNLLRSKLS